MMHMTDATMELAVAYLLNLGESPLPSVEIETIVMFLLVPESVKGARLLYRIQGEQYYEKVNRNSSGGTHLLQIQNIDFLLGDYLLIQVVKLTGGLIKKRI